MNRPLACRVFGCAWDFRREESTVVWTCARGCGGGGHRTTADPQDAQRLERQLHRGRPGPPLGLLAALAGGVHRTRSRARRR